MCIRDRHDGEHRASLEVKNNEIKGNKGDGFNFSETLLGSLVFEGNVIEDNLGHGVYFERAMGDLSIQSNRVKNNYYSGIYVRKEHWDINREDTAKRIVIKGNEVSGNKQGNETRDENGISLYYKSSAVAEITGNTVETVSYTHLTLPTKA